MGDLNVLLVTYVFPPASGVGAMRPASLARYIPGCSVRLDVLTTRNPAAVGSDSRLLQGIPQSVTVHRTIALDLPFGLKKRIKRFLSGQQRAKPPLSPPSASTRSKGSWLKKIAGNILLPDPQVTWLPILKGAAARIVKERGIDAVVITVPPFSSSLLVKYLRKRFPSLPIVIDFRDEWIRTAFDEISFLFSRSPHARRVAVKMEKEAVENATAVVTVTEAAKRIIVKRHPESADKFHLIPNGFDPEKIHAAKPASPTQRNQRVTVTYIGTVYTSTETTWIAEAVSQLPEEIRDKLLLRFIGHIEDPRYRDDLLRLGNTVEMTGFVPQQQALAAMHESDYMLLILHDPLNVSAKFFEYVGAAKPILATVRPGGAAQELMSELNAGWWVDSRDVDAIKQLFREAVLRRDSLALEFSPRTDLVTNYDRKVLAAKYAGLLYQLAGTGV